VWEKFRARVAEVEEEKKREVEKARWRTLGERREELVRRERRRRNLIWRGIEGDSKRERKGYLRGIIERALGREAEVREVEERLGEGGGG